MLEQKAHTQAQYKLLLKFMGLDLVIEYKLGFSNKVADALSRILEQCEFNALSTIVPNWLVEVQNCYATDSGYSEWMQKWEDGS